MKRFDDILSKFGMTIEYEGLNFRTPLKIFLDDYCGKHFTDLVYHKDMFLEEAKKELSVVLLKDQLIISKLIRTISSDKKDPEFIIFKIDYKNIFEPTVIQFGLGFHFKLNIIKSTGFDKFDELTFKLNLEKDVYLFQHFLEKQINLAWQEFFEMKCISPPCFYCHHFFLKKTNSKGNDQPRIVLISDKFIYNIEYSLTIPNDPKREPILYKIKELKYGLYIGSIESIVINKKDYDKKIYNIRLNINKKENESNVKYYNLPYKSKSNLDLIFMLENQFKYFLLTMKRLHFENTKKDLEIKTK